MLGLRTDLPLDRDAAAQFLPWILGFMVYLAALAVGSAMVVDRLSAAWQSGLTGNLTIEVPFTDDVGVAARSEVLDQVIDLLSATPGVAGTTLLDDREIARLLEPWLGPEASELDIPLPAMIAVTLREDADIDIAQLQQDLAAVQPGARVDAHADWIGDALGFMRGLKLLALLLTALVLGATAITIIFVTRTGLSIHRGVIEVVHLIGAPDAYIANQFQAQSLRLGLVGGIVGTLLAAATLIGADHLLRLAGPGLGSAAGMGEENAVGLTLDLHLLPWQWGVLALLPLATAFIAMVTARWTVLRSLARFL